LGAGRQAAGLVEEALLSLWLTDKLLQPGASIGGAMGRRILTRLGDGSLVQLTAAEIEADLHAGVEVAVRRAKVEPLTDDELDHLLDIFTSPARFSAVDYGDEVVLSCDGTGNADLGAPLLEQLVYQNHHGADMLELWHHDYSFKAVRTVLSFQTQLLKDTQLQTVVPLNYGAMPDLGRYSMPDGPAPNWSELLPLGKVAEAREAQMEAVAHLEKDMWYVVEAMVAAGADGIDFDTAGAAGDADLLATLRTARRLRATWPHIGVEIGQASELVLGMHGQLEYEGVRLAGQWPLGQLRVCTAAGATIFGPAVTVNTTKSLAWNTARTCALVKPVTAEATIPVHVNAGMGVGGVPMTPYPPVDAVSRASRAMVDVCRVDGL
jgi:dimethylamine--corrinoid protein Co-methyltransferase